MHRDLKTQNIFLLGNGRLVLGDLGISKVLDATSDFAETLIGTPYYMSPEIFQNKVRRGGISTTTTTTTTTTTNTTTTALTAMLTTSSSTFYSLLTLLLLLL